MEENFKEVLSDTLEEEYSLLSFKVKQLNEKTENYSKKNTMTSISTKNSLIEGSTLHLSPFKEQTLKSSLTSLFQQSIMSSSHKKKEEKNFFPTCSRKPQNKEIKKRNHTTIPYRQGKKKDNDKVTVKFVKKSEQKDNRHIGLFQVPLSSLLDVQGDGLIQLSNGIIMEGIWSIGQAVGPLKIRYQDKSQYEGEVYNLKPHGIGTLTYPSGHKYVGEFCYGDPQGEGIEFDEQGRVAKIGQWKKGIFFQ